MSIIDNAKEIADLIKKIGDIDLYRKIVELESQIIDITRERNKLEERCDELQKTLETSKAMKFDSPFYFQEGDVTPFCAKCWENSKKAIHLIRHHQMRNIWICTTCSSNIPDTRNKKEERA